MNTIKWTIETPKHPTFIKVGWGHSPVAVDRPRGHGLPSHRIAVVHWGWTADDTDPTRIPWSVYIAASKAARARGTIPMDDDWAEVDFDLMTD